MEGIETTSATNSGTQTGTSYGFAEQPGTVEAVQTSEQSQYSETNMRSADTSELDATAMQHLAVSRYDTFFSDMATNNNQYDLEKNQQVSPDSHTIWEANTDNKGKSNLDEKKQPGVYRLSKKPPEEIKKPTEHINEEQLLKQLEALTNAVKSLTTHMTSIEVKAA